jgi:hypothetical protein
MEKARARKAKKPLRLDVRSTALLFIHNYLKDVQRTRELNSSEAALLKSTMKEVRQHIEPRTVRNLSREMLGAQKAYWERNASDFQVQFVEDVEPLLVWIFSELKTDGTLRSSQKVCATP